MFGKTIAQSSRKARIFFWMSLILFILGFILTVVGVCLPFWTSIKDLAHLGVFQACGWSFQQCQSTLDTTAYYKDANWAELLWALAIVGMLFLLLTLVFIIVYMIYKTINHCKIALGIFVGVFLACGVIAILCALIIYVDYAVINNMPISTVFDNIGFAWYLTLVGLVVLVACFLCLVLHMFFMVYDEPTEVYPERNSSWRRR